MIVVDHFRTSPWKNMSGAD